MLESIKSMNEKNSRRYEEDVAKLKKMIEEYDKIKGNKKIHSNNQVSSLINISKQRYFVLNSCFVVDESWMFC
jgi:hypothetical protein